MLEPAVREERTGWRDQSISQRHRLWGFNCPAVDLDFLVVEYNVGKPVAIIEYKHHGAKYPDWHHPTYRALISLANIARLPFLVVFYHNVDWWFRVVPVNGHAKKYYEHWQGMTESEFVASLYRMRRVVLTNEIADKLHSVKPPSD